jgi:hypothetical protein
MKQLTIAETKEFIKDYYANMPYPDLYKKYGLTKLRADRLWDEMMKRVI